MPSQNRPAAAPPSYYGPQPTPAYTGAAAHSQQPSNYGVTPPYGTSPRITNPGGAGLVRPALPRSVGRVPTSYIGIVLVLFLAISFILVRQGIIPWFSSNSNNPSTVAMPFTENFQDNSRSWTAGTIASLTTGIVNNQYKIDVNSNGGAVTYFPHPNVGTLPANFTFTVTIEQTQGDQNAWFGLAFREKDDGNGGNVTCYAFGITSNGISTVQKYNPNATNKATTLGGSTNPVPGFRAGFTQLHTLQTIVQGNKFFFKVDNHTVPVSPSPDESITDTQYSGGQPTLYVSGTAGTFIVTSVQLAIP